MTTTDTLAERIGRILNEEGWTFEGVHEPGEYDECEDCRLAVAPIAARITTVAHAHLAAQEPTDAEVEAKIQADTDSLAAEIHEAMEFQYDQCDHGTYHGGHLHGEPYQMCRITAERIVRRRAVRRDEEKRAACGCDLTGLVPPAVHIVDRHEEK